MSMYYLCIKNIFVYGTGCNNYIVHQKGTAYFNLIIERYCAN